MRTITNSAGIVHIFLKNKLIVLENFEVVLKN